MFLWEGHRHEDTEVVRKQRGGHRSKLSNSSESYKSGVYYVILTD